MVGRSDLEERFQRGFDDLLSGHAVALAWRDGGTVGDTGMGPGPRWSVVHRRRWSDRQLAGCIGSVGPGEFVGRLFLCPARPTRHSHETAPGRDRALRRGRPRDTLVERIEPRRPGY